jgi:hypothetical protein
MIYYYKTSFKYIFFLYVYVIRLLYFLGIYKPSEKKESVLDEEEKFWRNKKKWFVEKVNLLIAKGKNPNENIESIFYSKKEYDDYMGSIRENKTELEKKWETKKMCIHSPRGNVCMYYDAYKMGFAYYCDQSNLGMKTLDACAMQYVIYNSCLDFHMNEETGWNFEKNELAKLHYNDVDAHKSIVKTMKSTRNINIKEATMIAKTKLKKNNEKQLEKPKMTNKYIHNGKMKDMDWLQRPKKKKITFFPKLKFDLFDDNHLQKCQQEEVDEEEEEDHVLSYAKYKQLRNASVGVE